MNEKMNLSEAACMVLSMAEQFYAKDDPLRPSAPEQADAIEMVAAFLEESNVDASGVGVTLAEVREDLK